MPPFFHLLIGDLNMANLNKVFLIGRLTRDPTIHKTKTDRTVVTFGLATNRSFTSQGEKQEERCFIDLVAFGPLADLIGKYASKGKEIFIEGHLTLSEWKSKEGENRSRLQVTVDQIQLLNNITKENVEEDPFNN